MKTISAENAIVAWLLAANHLRSTNYRDYNVILEIKNPMGLPPNERRVHDLVDKFLTRRTDTSLSTIANTIFPVSLYRRYGRSGVFGGYQEIYEKIKQHKDTRWGTYADRMLSRLNESGKVFNPLETLVEKLERQTKCKSPKRSTYELGIINPADCEATIDLPIYDPRKDSKQIMGTPCLSHLSFKLKDNKSLMLTAFYRSHYYIERALGNLIGLSWLQYFVAKEAGICTAEIVCISSMAQLDHGKNKKNRRGWGKADVNKLIDECLEILGLET